MGYLSRGNAGDGRKINHDRHRIDDNELRIDKVVQLARIAEVSEDLKRATVITEDGFLSRPLQFLTTGSADAQLWNPPNSGDKVLILCMSGKTNLGYILPYILPVGFDGSNRKTFEFIGEDGLKVTYDKNDNEYKIFGYGNEIVLNQNQVKIQKGSTVGDFTDNSIVFTAGGTTFTIDSSGATCNRNVSDLLGSMVEMRNRYNSHNHPGDSGGTTGPTSSPMI